MAKGRERRAVPRTTLAERLGARVPGMREVHLLDLNLAGAQIEHLGLLRLGVPGDLELPPPFGACRVPARVVWCTVIGRQHQARGRVPPCVAERPAVHDVHHRAARGPHLAAQHGASARRLIALMVRRTSFSPVPHGFGAPVGTLLLAAHAATVLHTNPHLDVRPGSARPLGGCDGFLTVQGGTGYPLSGAPLFGLPLAAFARDGSRLTGHSSCTPIGSRGLAMSQLTARHDETIGAVAMWITWAVAVLLGGGCATTDEQRFPLDYAAGHEATYQLDTAREALPAYQRMGADLEQRGLHRDAAIAYSNARQAARVLGRLQEALDASRKAVEMAERSGDPVQLAVALNRLGHTPVGLNAPQRAIPVFDRAAALRLGIQSPATQASTYYGLSQAYRRLGKPELAATNAMKAIAIMEAALQGSVAWWGGARGKGRWLRVMEYGYVAALWAAGDAYRALGQTERAREAFQKILAVASRIPVPNLMAQAERGLAVVAADERDWHTAVDHLEGASRLNAGPLALADI
jgi:tetratricopeptide (TPR) repeat protein